MAGKRSRPDITVAKSFEQQTYDYARNWALSRRGFLQSAAVAGGLALAGFGPRAAQAQQSGGHLRIGRSQDSDTLDPHKTFLLVSHEIMWQIYDSLIYLDASGNVYPGAAESWAFSNDNLTVTFKLRPGLNFHDGTPLNAEAVKFTADRHVAPETASPNAFLLGPLERVEVIDDLTVAYHYTEPFVPLWVGLSYSYCAPISPTAAKKHGDLYGRNPVGTGPFKFVSWQPDQGIRLERNEEHDWATPWYNNQGKAYLDSVEYVVIPEEATRLAALRSGDIDMISGDEALPLDKVRRLGQTPGLKTFTRLSAGVHFINLNNRKAFEDERLRKAVNYAIDREKIIALVMDGQAATAHSPVATSFPQYFEGSKDLGYPHDPEKARQLVVDAGHGDGIDVVFYTVASEMFRRIAEVVQEDLAKVGINVAIQSFPVAEYIPLAQKGDQDMAMIWYTYSDPDILFNMLGTGTPFNWSFTEDAELDKMLSDQRYIFDAAERKAAWQKVQERYVGMAYSAILYEGKYVAAMREEVQGVTLNVVGFHHLQEIWLEE